jgi:coenzyme F420-reducing hydrogenase alpha subunit
MQTDFSKKLDRADRLEAAYKAFAADPNNGVSAIDELANKLASTPTDNTGLSTSERKDLDRFLNSSTGKALADDFDRQQVSDLMNTVVAKIDATPYFSKLSEADQFTVLSTAVKQVNSLTSSVAARLDATRYFSKLPQPAQKVAL